jgi:hypothetical protein
LSNPEKFCAHSSGQAFSFTTPPAPTLATIIDQAGYTVEEFIELL